MGAILVRDILSYGVSVLALGYLIYVMLHPEVDDRSSPAKDETTQRRNDAGVLRWCAEQWRLQKAGKGDWNRGYPNTPSVSGTRG